MARRTDGKTVQRGGAQQRRCLEETRGDTTTTTGGSSLRDSNYTFHLPNAFRENCTSRRVRRHSFQTIRNHQPLLTANVNSPSANFPMLSALRFSLSPLFSHPSLPIPPPLLSRIVFPSTLCRQRENIVTERNPLLLSLSLSRQLSLNNSIRGLGNF